MLQELEEKFSVDVILAMALQESEDRHLRRVFAGPHGFIEFIEYFWDVLEPDTKFLRGWALEAMALHLEATVDDAHGIKLTRVLENVSPGSCKSLMLVFFTAWVWGPKKKPGARFLCMSYSGDNPERDNRKLINLINSDKFQRLYGNAFRLTKAGEELIETSRTGFRQALGIRGSVTGKRADWLLVDDPNNVVEGESDAIRNETNRKFKEAVVNRLNDMSRSVIFVIQQRSHEDDVSGHILALEWPYVHLCIPMLYEPDRECVTPIWRDPRMREGENYWPERYPEDAVQSVMDMGEFAFAGQYQQRPEPRGGGIIKREYWQDWNPEPDPVTRRRSFPKCDFILASLDPAFTEKEENDPAGFTIWGAYLTETGERAVILMHAFRERLELIGVPNPRLKGETVDDHRQRCQAGWGLVEKVHDLCTRYKVDVLLVENKASGLSVIQAMEKLFAKKRFRVEVYDPKKLDKMARVIRVQPEFAHGYVYAPHSKVWAEMVMRECALFPRGKYDDLTDSTSAAIYWLRTNGFLERREEQFLSREEALKNYKAPQPLYEV